MVKKTFVINGVTRNILVDENETLATFLRERLLLTGCKIGCGEGHCGACNVIVNGKVTRSCLTAATPTSTRTAWSPCTRNPLVSTCICP